MYRSLEDTEIDDISYTNSLQLSEAIMSSSIVGHKIRNIKEKLSSIGPNSQVCYTHFYNIGSRSIGIKSITPIKRPKSHEPTTLLSIILPICFSW